jgi:SAM-dependent methyltransferase
MAAVPIEFLRCPRTCEPLVHCGDGLISTSGRFYPVVDRVPVLLDTDLSAFSFDEVAQRRYVEQSSSRSRALARRVIPSRTLAIGSAERYADFARRIHVRQSDHQGQVLVIGGGQLGQGGAPLMDSGLRVVTSDVYLSPRVDVVCDGHNLPFAAETFDGVVLQAVLEHVLDPVRVVEEAYRVLRTDGILYAESPFLQGVHEGAFDFTRWTELGHRRLFRMFTEIDRGVVCGPATMLLWAIGYFARSLPKESSHLALLLDKLTIIMFFWLKYLDRELIDHRGATDGASGTYFMGRKSAVPTNDRDILATYRGTVGRPRRRAAL